MVADDDSCGMLKGSSSCVGLSRCCCCCCSALVHRHLRPRPHRCPPGPPPFNSAPSLRGGRRGRFSCSCSARTPSQGFVAIPGFARPRGRTRSRGSPPGEGYVVAQDSFGAESRCSRADAA